MAKFETVGYNYRMSDLQGAVGFAQIKKLKSFINFRKKYANFYKRLSKFKGIQTPKFNQYIEHSWQAYVCLINMNFRNIG